MASLYLRWNRVTVIPLTAICGEVNRVAAQTNAPTFILLVLGKDKTLNNKTDAKAEVDVAKAIKQKVQRTRPESESGRHNHSWPFTITGTRPLPSFLTLSP